MDPNTSVVCTPYPPTGPDGTPLSVSPEWRTETVRALAHGIRTDEAFDRMPILADALEEAGCDDLVLLNHCRHCERHVAGCWVLDQIDSVDEVLEYDEPSELVMGEITSFQKAERISQTVLRGICGVILAVVFGLPLLAAIQVGILNLLPTPPAHKPVPSIAQGLHRPLPPE
jgi:hypothetical protein